MSKFCIKCGAQLSDGAGFCGSCGAKQPAPATAETPVAPAAPPPAPAAETPVAPQPAPATAETPVAPAAPAKANPFTFIAEEVTKGFADPARRMGLIGKYGIVLGLVIMIISCFINFFDITIKYEMWGVEGKEIVRFNPLICKIVDYQDNISFPFMGWIILILAIVAIVMVVLNKKVPTIILSAIAAGYGFITAMVTIILTVFLSQSYAENISVSDINDLREYCDELTYRYVKGPTAFFMLLGMVVVIVGIVLFAKNYKKSANN